MTAYTFPTRRMLLKDMGKAGLAIMVFGTAACGDDEASEDPTSTSEQGTTAGQGATTTTAPAPSSTSGPAEAHQWVRANLGVVSAYVLYRAGEAALVDTGVPDSEGVIEASLVAAGLDWGSVGHVIITHKHPDHQGSLQAVLSATGDARWYAGAGDLASVIAASAGNAVGDGDKVFDLDIIESPGHTPGHICVHDPVGGILLAGDAVVGADGGVAGPVPDFSEDVALANASVSKLAGFDYEVILFGHGEPVTSGGSAAVAELAPTLG